jgi:hypothetical protein
MKDGWYWYSTKWACGGVAVKDRVIIDGCPIYRKMIGWKCWILKKNGAVWVTDL